MNAMSSSYDWMRQRRKKGAACRSSLQPAYLGRKSIAAQTSPCLAIDFVIIGRHLMEAAALYAFSVTSGHSIVCFAHVTNSMAQTVGDFEKGEADGAKATLAVVAVTARAWRG